MTVAPESGRNRIMIYGPKRDGTYVVEFKAADGEALAISVPAGEARVLKRAAGSRDGCIRQELAARMIFRPRGGLLREQETLP
jgi:hypothetical protein